MANPTLQYVSNENGDVTAVLVPITIWREIASELETQHLLRSPAMRERLLRARREEGGVPLSEVLRRFGITEDEVEAGEAE